MLPLPEICSSNPITGKLTVNCTLKTKINKKMHGMAQSKNEKNIFNFSEGEADRKEEEDDGEERQPEPLLQRVLRIHGRSE